MKITNCALSDTRIRGVVPSEPDVNLSTPEVTRNAPEVTWNMTGGVVVHYSAI